MRLEERQSQLLSAETVFRPYKDLDDQREFSKQLDRVLALVEACQKKYPVVSAMLDGDFVQSRTISKDDIEGISICSALHSMETNCDI